MTNLIRTNFQAHPYHLSRFRGMPLQSNVTFKPLGKTQYVLTQKRGITNTTTVTVGVGFIILIPIFSILFTALSFAFVTQAVQSLPVEVGD
jgi:hypothetical protein